jgi:RimJ/RimL family protein N-acetyltransferase
MRDLTTERLLLRRLLASDWPIAEVVFRQSWAYQRPATEDPQVLRDHFQRCVLADRVFEYLCQPPLTERAITLRRTGEVVGLAGFVACVAPFGQLPSFGGYPNVPYTPEIELCWAVLPKHQGRGYATEAGRALVEFAFNDFRLKRVVACTDRTNLVSRRVMEKIGMRVELNPFPEPVWLQAVGWVANSAHP